MCLWETQVSMYHLISPSYLLVLPESLYLTLVSLLILILGAFMEERVYGLLLLINLKEYDYLK